MLLAVPSLYYITEIGLYAECVIEGTMLTILTTQKILFDISCLIDSRSNFKNFLLMNELDSPP